MPEKKSPDSSPSSRKRKLHHRIALWVFFSVVGIITAYSLLAVVATTWYNHKHAHDPYLPGVSYSDKYARELGIDPRAGYLALLNDVKVRRFRLMSYWDEMEPQPGKYDFNELDFQMQQAEGAGAKVSLAIGLRQPRYPECHAPDWATKLDKTNQEEALKQYMAVVVERYKKSSALVSYQLENEALNTAFGLCKDFDRSRLQREYDFVKQLDPDHPIVVSVSNEFGLPLGEPRPDVVGFSIYHRVYDQHVTHRYVEYPFPPSWHGVRAAFIEAILHRPVMIHELQTEPWGPEATEKLSITEQNKSMDATRMLNHVHYAQQTGIREYYLWGGEWWYWRLTKFNDPSLWNAAKEVFSQTGQVPRQ